MFLSSKMGGFELVHHWHGMDVLILLEITMIATLCCLVLAVLGGVRRKKRLTILSIIGAVSFATAAYAANTALSALTAGGSVAGTDLFYDVKTPGTGGVKVTGTQFAAYINGLFSGDCTVTGTGTVTCLKTNGTAFGALATVTPGTGVATALADNIGSAGAPVVFNGAGGTPSSITLTSGTGLPISTGVSGLGTGIATWLATPSSANLASALTDETGTGVAVFGTAPTISSLNASVAMTLAFLTGGGTQCLTVGNTGTVGAQACSGATGANPTATASDTAVNGVATTFMRSDAAPAIQKTSSSVFGLAKVDGTTITASAGVISAVGGGSGTVTSVATGCGASGGPITSTGTISAAITARTNSTTTDAIVSTDCGNVIYENNAGSIAVSIAQAGTTGFLAGTFFEVCNINAGVATITPTTSTIGGASTKQVLAGTAAQPTCVGFQSDGTNYNLVQVPVTGLPIASITGLGTGVAAALADNIGSAGAPVVNGGALGTPSSGVATNLTGTAAGMTAGNVTTNANLTGDVTSSGNAATLATVNSNVGSFTSANITVDGKGRITAAANGSGGGGTTAQPSAYITGGAQFYLPNYGMNEAAGTTITANTTAYCSFGTVASNVTIKALTFRLSTGVAASNGEMAIYSFANPLTNTMTLVDTSNAQVATTGSGTNIQTSLANTTDTLSAGTLYAFCLASSGALATASFLGGSTATSAILGSSTVSNVVAASQMIGKSFPVTYSSTPSSTFPGTLSLSTGTDIVSGTAMAPLIAILVN